MTAQRKEKKGNVFITVCVWECESADKAERLAARVAELEAEKESGAAALADATKMKQLESEVRESQASLILARHQAEELERKLTSTHQQLTNTQQELNDVKTTLAKYQAEVMTLRNSNVLLEQEAAELAALRARAALADTLTSQLHRETERAALAEEALSKERARADTCARREAAALEHAARLTAHHVAERAQTDHEKDKATALAADNASLRETVTALKAEVEELKRSLSAEESRRTSESKTLARRVAELTEELKTTNEKLDWERAENGLLKKRHATALKEVNRELQRALKRCEQLEAKVPHDHDESVRTGSVSSLSSDGIMNHHSQNLEVSSSPDDVPVNGQSSEPEKPDRQALIERIVQLQRSLARRADRCEFLEEHARHLTSELRRKSRLLRHALPALPAGALPTAASDRHKKEVAALGGGAMAAVWGAGDADALSPQLALEMNRRLHAVLEDALLKNITLKENLDTLGEEIARLKSEKGAR
ncbi:Coiled-coil domain-containing protein 186 [Eumeta japonica]|uniref:Coiled-coil domain-containing protein 186 n=1 Tax=Eumeta variegata TaxID=151549 RepID=A0A4C1VHW7_EUMVA|nr:Coiled-coil domain-containing protein 186 [Eumeta japonica]